MLRSCNGDTVTGAYVRELREFIGASGNAFRDCPSMQETEREREHHRTDKTAEKIQRLSGVSRMISPPGAFSADRVPARLETGVVPDLL